MVDRMQARLRGEGGFTIIELMIVLLIIGILLALGLAKFAPAVEAAKSLKAQAQVSNALKDAMGYYAVDGDFESVTGDSEDEENPLTSVSLTVAEQEPVIEDSDPAEPACDRAGLLDEENGGVETVEGTLYYCANGQDFAALTRDHSDNEWSGEIHDGSISGPVK